jgi:hypothetical protein
VKALGKNARIILCPLKNNSFLLRVKFSVGLHREQPIKMINPNSHFDSFRWTWKTQRSQEDQEKGHLIAKRKSPPENGRALRFKPSSYGLLTMWISVFFKRFDLSQNKNASQELFLTCTTHQQLRPNSLRPGNGGIGIEGHYGIFTQSPAGHSGSGLHMNFSIGQDVPLKD